MKGRVGGIGEPVRSLLFGVRISVRKEEKMCGIFAYINFNVSRERRHILEVLFNGLRRLEYRGYDSAGISIDADGDGGPAELRGLALPGFFPLVFREEGKIEKPVTSVYKGRFPIIAEIELKF